MLEKLRADDFENVFEIMKDSFPKDEYRPFEEQKALLKVPEYQIYAFRNSEAQTIKAFIAVWNFSSTVFIEHFAVNSEYRNCGLGSKMLKELTDKLKKPLCLEVELPKDQISARRIEFYKRNNFFLNKYPYIMPPVSKGRKPLNMQIMTSGRPISQNEFEEIKALLYSRVYNCPI